MKLPYLLKELHHFWSKESFQAAPLTPSSRRPILFTTGFLKVLLYFGVTNCACLLLCLPFFCASAANRNKHKLKLSIKLQNMGFIHGKASFLYSNNAIIGCHGDNTMPQTVQCPGHFPVLVFTQHKIFEGTATSFFFVRLSHTFLKFSPS